MCRRRRFRRPVGMPQPNHEFEGPTTGDHLQHGKDVQDKACTCGLAWTLLRVITTSQPLPISRLGHDCLRGHSRAFLLYESANENVALAWTSIATGTLGASLFDGGDGCDRSFSRAAGCMKERFKNHFLLPVDTALLENVMESGGLSWSTREMVWIHMVPSP